MYKACGQDKIARASIQTYDVMVACSNSEELCPDLFRRRKGITTKLNEEKKFKLIAVKREKKMVTVRIFIGVRKKKLVV